MIRHRLAFYTLAALAIWGGITAAGCDAITGPSELERQIAAEQAAIKAYSDQVAAADGLQRAFVEAWKAANEKKQLAAYKEALQLQVLPAMDRYLEAARAMPTQGAELTRIHTIILDAYTTAREAFGRFAERVTDTSIETDYAAVLAAMEQVSAAEKRYLAALTQYYAKNRVTLKGAGE